MATLAQQYVEAFPVAELVQHPDNPRRGDLNVLEESIRTNDFYGAVLVQTSTRRIVAGNHRVRAAQRVGDATVPVLLADLTDEQARRILLVDNRANDVAGYDKRILAELLRDLEDDLTGTGWTGEDLSKLLDDLDLAPPSDFPTVDEVTETEYRCPSCGYEWNGVPHPKG